MCAFVLLLKCKEPVIKVLFNDIFFNMTQDILNYKEEAEFEQSLLGSKKGKVKKINGMYSTR